jgi:hypothetical protein
MYNRIEPGRWAMERFHLAQKGNDEAFGNRCQAADCAPAGKRKMHLRFLHRKRYNYLVNMVILRTPRLEEPPQEGTVCRSKAMPWIRAR